MIKDEKVMQIDSSKNQKSVTDGRVDLQLSKISLE